MAARVSPRRRCAAALLLCATLVLATACARAASIVVSGDVTQSGSTFNGDSITFDLGSSSADVVTVQLLNSQVSGSGLSIQGYSGSVPSGVSTRVSMSVSATTVTSSTIAFTGVMPSNSDIRLATTTGTLGASQSLFDFSGLKLAGNVTVTVEDSSVSWPSGAANTGSIVTYSTGSTSVGIDDKSALFILNATATNGASVLHIATSSVFSVTNTAVLAIDYGRCDGCSSAMVDIDVPLQVDGSSMFRITHATVVNGNAGLLSSAGSVAVSDKSLYLISDSTIEAGSFFNFVTGADPSASTTTAFDFSVSTSSTVSFLNLVGPATGIPAGTHIPNTNDGTGVVNGGSCTIDGTALTTAAEYQSNGIQVTEVVNSNGASSGTCANAQCVPGNSADGAAEVSGTACSCTCTASTFTPPSCISGSDPTQNYNNGATCTLANCDTCDRLYPSSRCSRCAKGYEVSSSTYQCQLINVVTTTTTAKPTTTTTTAKPTPTTTALCTVSYCAQCRPADGSTCTTCRNGYRLTGGSCIANINAASAAQSALLAAVVCAAAAVYTL